MKICHFITTLELGGAETLLANFCNIQINEHEIYIIYLKGENKVLELLDPRIKIINIPFNSKSVFNIRNFLKTYKPDIFHTHLGHADLIGLWAARSLPVKTFCTMHNIYFKWDWRDHIIFFIYFLLFKTVARECQVICISKIVTVHVLKTLKVSEKKIHLLYNGIPEPLLKMSKQEARGIIGIPEEKFVLLFVGRLEKQKAVHILLNAVSKIEDIPNLHIEVIGTGSLMEEYKALVKELNIKNLVAFRGNIIKPEIYFLAADVFILPSIFEGLGIVLLEAFRAKLPIIASNVEGPAELLENGKNGILFNSLDENDLVSKIKEVYNNINLRDKITVNGYKMYEENFTIKFYSRRLEQFYVSKIKSK